MNTKQPPKKNSLKIAVGAIALCLAAGIGIGAAFVLREDDPVDSSSSENSLGTSREGAQDSPSSETSSADTPEVLYKVICDNVEGSLQKKFVGADHVPSLNVYHTNPIMEAENGWYYVDTPDPYDPAKRLIRYCDAATGETVILCARPECTHNNQYCTAQNSRYTGIPSVYYEGCLYGISGVSDEESPLEEDDQVWFDDQGDIVLVRYAPDGTELTRVASFSDAVPDSLEHTTFTDVEIIGHRGALWIAAGFYREYVLNDGDETTAMQSRGYGLFYYDIDSAELTSVLYYPITEDSRASAPARLQGVGDFVYFKKSNADWKDPLNGDNVYRVDIRSGAVELIARGVNVNYAIAEDRLVYLDETIISDQSNCFQVRCMDLNTGESRLFLGESDFASNVQCTGEYVLLTKRNTPFKICIYDWEGDLLQTLPALPLMETESKRSQYVSMAVSGDRLYGVVYHTLGMSEVRYISLAAAIADDNDGWLPAYTANDLHSAVS